MSGTLADGWLVRSVAAVELVGQQVLDVAALSS
jgi:hypothetical protein